ncbi:MAG: hypothetical protein H7A27_08530 [Spirochaetaceae bacterium]|nr:hypothetical protein [Spirochaetaceae bacterium]
MIGPARLLAASIATAFTLAAATPLAAQPASGWYVSDPSGLAIEPSDGRGDAEYALLVTESGGAFRSELYRDGEAVRAWLRTYGRRGALVREAMEEGGSIREERLYDDAGQPTVERIFLSGGAVEETAYEYASGRLVSKTTSRDGAVAAVTSYLYAPDGRLAMARSTGGAAAGAAPSSSWTLGPLGLELRSYDGEGRLVRVSVYVGAEEKRREERSWKGGRVERLVVVESSGTELETVYATDGPAAGKVVSGIERRGGRETRVESRAYDAEGRLVLVETSSGNTGTSSGGTVTAIVYEYGESGELASASTRIDGELVTVTRYETDGARVEESYDSGELFARVRFEDGRRVLEELFEGGAVIQARRFE